MKKYIWAHEEHAITPLTISPNHNAWAAKILIKLLDNHKVGKRTFCTHKNYGLSFYCDEKDWDRGSDYLINKIRAKPDFVKEIKAKSEKLSADFIKIIRQTEKKDLKQWTNNQLTDFLVETYKLSLLFCVYGYIPVLSDHLFNKYTKLLKNIVTKSISKKRLKFLIPEIVNILSSPSKAIPSRQARTQFLEIVYKLKNKNLTKSDQNKIFKHYQKWFWVNFGHLGPRITLPKMTDSVRHLFKQKSKIKKELNGLYQLPKVLIKEQNRLFNKLGLTEEEKYLFKVAQLFTYLKGLRMEILFGVYAQWERVLKEMALRFKIPQKLLYYCSIAELANWLKKGKRISLKTLKERAKFCVWVALSENNQLILTGQKAKQYLKKNIQKAKQKLSNVLIIHGTVASVGYAKGHVKIVNKASEINKVRKGDILVSVATNPSLLPAMKKAVAFVTDAGGLTSHAAIVARELKKPCIIGTKVATKVLKDNDLIELDTKKGDIKKIES
ncbi:hypothetical protein KKF32_02805 [Patescibacteria group bacterium]|nr:hypothetical protein [Patescibacteria group bacterium]